MSTKRTKTVRMQVALPFHSSIRDDRITLYCDVLKAHGLGRTVTQARKNLKDTIALLFEGAIEDGTLESVLTDCGFSPVERAGVVGWEVSFTPLENVNYAWLQESLRLRPKVLGGMQNSSGDHKIVQPFMISASETPPEHRVG